MINEEIPVLKKDGEIAITATGWGEVEYVVKKGDELVLKKVTIEKAEVDIDAYDVKRLEELDGSPRILGYNNLLECARTTVYRKKNLVNIFMSVRPLKKDGTAVSEVEQFTLKMTLDQMKELHDELEKRMKKLDVEREK